MRLSRQPTVGWRLPFCGSPPAGGSHGVRRDTAMEDRTRPATMAPPVVKLPEEIDATNSGQVMADIAAVCLPGVTTVIADLTRTTFCDSSAVRALVRAHKVALSRGAELKLAVGSDA